MVIEELYRPTAAVFCAVTSIKCCVRFPLLGAPAAAGPQAAAERPAHQTCPEDHEVSASAQGKKHVIAVLLAKHQRRVCYGVANIQVEKPKHLHTNLCAEMLITHNVVWSGCD